MNSSEFVTKRVSIREALHEINDQILLGSNAKAFHPIGLFYFLTTGQQRFPNLTHYTKTCKQNCLTVRGVINAYLQKRKRGEIKSQIEGETDLLSLFLRAPDIFTDEFIIDELMDFFLMISEGTRIERTGWIQMGILDSEKIAGHMFRMAVMAILFDEEV